MMGNVVDLFHKIHQQIAQGEAFCLGCGHDWKAAIPTGTLRFECPSCYAMKGLWKFEFSPKDGELLRECGCGNRLFYLTKNGHMCAACGIHQRYSPY